MKLKSDIFFFFWKMNAVIQKYEYELELYFSL